MSAEVVGDQNVFYDIRQTQWTQRHMVTTKTEPDSVLSSVWFIISAYWVLERFQHHGQQLSVGAVCATSASWPSA